MLHLYFYFYVFLYVHLLKILVSEFALQLRDAKFAWEKNGADILTDLNLNVKYGQLIAVVGPVGCGKSSLLSAICGEMRKLSGSITVNVRLKSVTFYYLTINVKVTIVLFKTNQHLYLLW